MRRMSSLLYHVSPVDPWTYAAATLSSCNHRVARDVFALREMRLLVDPVHAFARG
jgi:hypothetical protein